MDHSIDIFGIEQQMVTDELHRAEACLGDTSRTVLRGIAEDVIELMGDNTTESPPEQFVGPSMIASP